MAGRSICNVCCDPQGWSRSQEGFRAAELKLLCELLDILSGSFPVVNSLIPTGNDTLSLGDGTHYWKDFYLAGVFYMAGTIAGNLIPDANGTRSIGSAAAYWKDLFIAGKAKFTGTIDSDLIPDVTNTDSLGSASKLWKDLFIAGKAKFSGTIDSNLVPDATNADDLGSSTKLWKNLYLAGNANITTMIFGDSSTASTAALIRGARADGSDDGSITITGGGATGITRGGYVTLYGNENTTSHGGALVSSGNYNGALVDISMNAADGFGRVNIKNGTSVIFQVTQSGGVSHSQDITFGGAVNIKKTTAEITNITAGASHTVAGALPAGSIVLGVTTRVTQAVAMAGTGFSVGDGTTATRWGSNILKALNTTSTAANFLASTAPYQAYPTATNLVFTAVGGNFTGGAGNGKIRYTIYYMDLTAMSS